MKLARPTMLRAGLLAGQLLVLSAPTSGAVTPAALNTVVKASTSYGRSAFDATNHQRERRDRRKLAPSACLRKYAVRQARKMAGGERIWHQDLQRILGDCNLSWVGENVAAGFPSGRSVVDDGWMKSPDHRANLLARKFRMMQVVARKGADGRWYVSQVFGKRA